MSNAKLYVSKKDETDLKIRCEDRGILYDLNDFFSFRPKNYQFSPKYKNKLWDGYIRLFRINTQELPVGLYRHLQQYCKERSYELVEEEKIFLSQKFDESFLKNINLPFQPREYQLNAIKKAIETGRLTIVSPTGSGKSFIQYLIMRWYNKKTIIIVPTTALVLQMHDDFREYGYKGKIALSTDGTKALDVPDADVYITTWQTAVNKNPKWFLQFGVVLGDEAHEFEAKSLGRVMGGFKRTPHRFGFTGTLDESRVHELTIQGMFGPIYVAEEMRALIDRGEASNMSIKILLLQYPEYEKKALAALKRQIAKEKNKNAVAAKMFQQEVTFLQEHEIRNLFIKKLASSRKGNTIVLFERVEKHGKVLYNQILDYVKEGRKVFFVYGGTDKDDRNEIRKIVEKETDAIIVASYGTFSRGVNIKNLHHIIFASSSKSKRRVLQSLGRGSRLDEQNWGCIIYDLADDLQVGTKPNYMLKQLNERIRIYSIEKHKFKLIKVDLYGN